MLFTHGCYTFSESYGTKEHSGNQILMSWVEIKLPGILSSLRTQTGPWSDTFSYYLLLNKVTNNNTEQTLLVDREDPGKFSTCLKLNQMLSFENVDNLVRPSRSDLFWPKVDFFGRDKNLDEMWPFQIKSVDLPISRGITVSFMDQKGKVLEEIVFQE